MQQTFGLTRLMAASSGSSGGISSSLGGLEINDAGGGDLFSGFLVDAETSEGASNAIGASASQTASEAESASTLSVGDAVEDVEDIINTLRKVLSFLPSSGDNLPNSAVQDAGAMSSETLATSDEGESCDMGSFASTLFENLLSLSSKNDQTSVSSEDATDVSDVVTELLALMQLVVQATAPLQPSSGGTDSATASGSTDLSTALADAADTTTGAALSLFVQSGFQPTGSTLAEELLNSAQAKAETLLEKMSQALAAGSDAASLDFSDVMSQLANVKDQIQESLDRLHQSLSVERTAEKPMSIDQGADLLKPALLSLNDAACVNVQQNISDVLSLESDPDVLDETLGSLKDRFSSLFSGASKKSGVPKTASNTSDTEASTASQSVETSFAATSYDPDLSVFRASSARTGEQGFLSQSDSGSNDAAAGSSAAMDTGVNLSANGVSTTNGTDFATALSAVRSSNKSASSSSVVDRVVLKLSRNVKDGQSKMSLQLHPEELGKITISLDFSDDGTVQGTVVADNAKTLEILQKDSGSLERALQDAGLRAESGSLQFSLGEQKEQNNAGLETGSSGSNRFDNAESGSDDDSEEGSLAEIGTLSETYYVTPQGVNIRV